MQRPGRRGKNELLSVQQVAPKSQTLKNAQALLYQCRVFFGRGNNVAHSQWCCSANVTDACADVSGYRLTPQGARAQGSTPDRPRARFHATAARLKQFKRKITVNQMCPNTVATRSSSGGGHFSVLRRWKHTDPRWTAAHNCVASTSARSVRGRPRGS